MDYAIRISRNELCDMVKERSGVSKVSTRRALDTIRDILIETAGNVAVGESAQIILFEGMQFILEVVPERQRYNPKTREEVVLGPTVKIKSHFTPTLKDALNGEE